MRGGVFATTFSLKRFEETLPLSCAGIVLLMFACGCLGVLELGVYIVIACSAAMCAASIFTIIRKKRWNSVCRRLFTPGFVLFCLLYVVLTVLHVGRMAHSWDEFSHWADVVKAMFAIDDFSTNPASNSQFKSYMPGMPLFQYFVEKLHQMLDSDKAFSEWRMYFSYQIFSYTFLFPFLKNISFRKIFSGALLFVGICLSPMVFFCDYFPTTVYIDAFVGIVAGSGFAMLYVNRQKDVLSYLNLLAAMSMLVLAKDVGMLFALFLAAATVIDYLAALGKEYRATGGKPLSGMKRLTLVIGGIAAVFLPKMLWNFNIAAWHVTKSFSQPIDFKMLLNVFNGVDHTYRTDVLHRFIEKFYTGTYSVGEYGISLSWFATFVILFVGLISLHLVFCRDLRERTVRRLIIAIVLIQACFYVLGMCAIYMFRFTEYEALKLASFERYIGIVLLAMQMMLMLMFFSCMQEHIGQWYTLCVIALFSTLLILPKEDIQNFINRSSVATSIESRARYETMASQLHEITLNERSNVYIVSQQNTGYDYHVLKYSIRPCTTGNEEFGGWSLSTTGPLYEGDIWTRQKTAEQWKEQLQLYDYVLICHVDDTFIRDYASVFVDPSQIADNGIFAVDHQTGLLVRCL